MSLARHQFTVTDQAGNIVAGAHVEVRSEIPGQPLVALYSDRAGTVALGNPIDADSNGYVYFHVVGGAYQIRVYTGTSAAPTTEHFDRYVPIGLNSESDSIFSLTMRTVTAAGAVTIEIDEVDVVIVNKTVSQATTVNLPAAATFTKTQVAIKDGKGDVASYPISVTPAGSETIDGQTGARLIDWPYGGLRLAPVTGGWITLP